MITVGLVGLLRGYRGALRCRGTGVGGVDVGTALKVFFHGHDRDPWYCKNSPNSSTTGGHAGGALVGIAQRGFAIVVYYGAVHKPSAWGRR